MDALQLALADSELARATVSSDTLQLRFAAMPVTQVASDADRRRPPSGYIVGVTLTLHDAVIIRSDGPLIGRVSSGDVTFDDLPLTLLTLHGCWTGQLRIMLQGGDRFQLEATGRRLSIATDAPVQVRESYAC
jgi:hypothetical protein